jgi:hypothetical protein
MDEAAFVDALAQEVKRNRRRLGWDDDGRTDGERVRALGRERHGSALRELAALAERYEVQPDALGRLLVELRRLPTVCTVNLNKARKQIQIHSDREKEQRRRHRPQGKLPPSGCEPGHVRPGAERAPADIAPVRGGTARLDSDGAVDAGFLESVRAARDILERAAALDAADGRRAMPAWHLVAAEKLRSLWREQKPGQSDRPYVSAYSGRPHNGFTWFACNVPHRLWRWSEERCTRALKRQRRNECRRG